MSKLITPAIIVAIIGMMCALGKYISDNAEAVAENKLRDKIEAKYEAKYEKIVDNYIILRASCDEGKQH